MSYPSTIAEAARKLRAGEITSSELVRQTLARIEASNLGAYVSTFAPQAIENADFCDQELRRGTDRGPIHGIPIGIKETIATRENTNDITGRCVDAGWYHWKDSAVVETLRAAGAIIVGTTTTSESVTLNPWDQERWPGGSSAGAAAGLAAGEMLGSVGTDSGGSIRCPAAFCGVTGFKPSFGSVPTDGCIQVGFSYDTVGPLAKTAWDCANLFEVMSGRPVMGDLTGDLSGLRVGIYRESYRESDLTADPALEAALDAVANVLQVAGAELGETKIPHAEALATTTMLAYPAEGYAANRNRLRDRYTEYSSAVRTNLLKGVLLTAGDLTQLNRVRAVGKRDIDRLFENEFDLIIAPTAPSSPKFLSETNLLEGLPPFTALWNAVGYPVISVPMGFTRERMPLGVQIAGRTDGLVLRAADAYQRRTSWHLASPDSINGERIHD